MTETTCGCKIPLRIKLKLYFYTIENDTFKFFKLQKTMVLSTRYYENDDDIKLRKYVMN